LNAADAMKGGRGAAADGLQRRDRGTGERREEAAPSPEATGDVARSGPPVFLVPPGELTAPGQTVVLSGPEGRHAAVVRRLRPGERADLSDGAGTLASGVVDSASPQSVAVTVRSVLLVPAPSPRITVIQALAKGDRGELAVEMMTEVGVDAVVAWSAERSVVRWEGSRGERSLLRWASVAREAAKQSRRAWIPSVSGPASLPEVSRAVSAAACAVVLEADAAVPLSGLALPVAGEIVLVVGPEGGVSPGERSALAAAGAIEARLGPTVLRTSTAGTAAAAVLLSRSGRW
jgi:16S rRNA (uracil1498-N3)-methyltransferase